VAGEVAVGACGGGGVLKGRWRGAGWGAPRQSAHSGQRQSACACLRALASRIAFAWHPRELGEGTSPQRLGRLAEHTTGREGQRRIVRGAPGQGDARRPARVDGVHGGDK
jgi:hypothetical protein